MSKSPSKVPPTTGKTSPKVLGRSAVTGRFVLKPASKAGALTMKDAQRAVRTVVNEKKA